MTEYVVKRKRINSEGETFWPGDVVPGAGGWKNLRAYTGAGILVAVEDDEAAAPSLEEGVADLGDDVVVAGDEVVVTDALDLSELNKRELRERARAAGLNVPNRISRDDLLDLLTGP